MRPPALGHRKCHGGPEREERQPGGGGGVRKASGRVGVVRVDSKGRDWVWSAGRETSTSSFARGFQRLRAWGPKAGTEPLSCRQLEPLWLRSQSPGKVRAELWPVGLGVP